MRAPPILITAVVLAGGWLAGCAGAPVGAETTARDQVRRVGGVLAPPNPKPALPTLNADSPPPEFIRYAVLNHPGVLAAYYDWRATVGAITPARALPDPKLTLQADVADTLMSFMPGLMFDLMASGKRAAMGREAAAAGEVAHRAFAAEVLHIAAEVRKAWVELAYVAEADRLYATTIHAVNEALALADADYATTRSTPGFDRQIRLQNLAAEHHSHHATVADRLVAARARFKSALGLAPGDADPLWPQPALVATPLPAGDELWRRADAANPELARMRAMVDMTVASIEVARNAGTPDASLGAMVDLKANPLMVRPTATLSLPIWREKLAATVAAAEARRDAAVARVSGEQLNLAAELAQMLFMVREADRMLSYLDHAALPNLERGLAFAEASAQSGPAGAAMIAETRLMVIDLRHERLDKLRERELAAVDLALLIADGGSLPEGLVPAAP